MCEQDKLSVLYRRERFNFTIVPRGASGWTQFGIWMVLLAALTAGLVIYAEAHDGSPRLHLPLGLYLGATAIWSLIGVGWMKSRAEIVDVHELLRMKREAEHKERGC